MNVHWILKDRLRRYSLWAVTEAPLSESIQIDREIERSGWVVRPSSTSRQIVWALKGRLNETVSLPRDSDDKTRLPLVVLQFGPEVAYVPINQIAACRVRPPPPTSCPGSVRESPGGLRSC